MLLSFDFDGTLVEPPEILEPPAEFFRHLQTLRSKGAVWVVNTGRNLKHALEGIEEAGLMPLQPDYLLLREQEIWEPDGNGGWRDCGNWNQMGREKFAAWLEEHQQVLSEIRQNWEQKDVGRWIEDEEDPAGLLGWTEAAIEEFVVDLQQWKRRYPRLSWQRNGVWLRFMVEGYNKGTTLQWLAQRLEISKKRVFAMGDGWNDLEMLDSEVAARFACPGNAVSEVSCRVADRGGWLFGRPASYAVAQALERLIAEGWGE